MLNTSFNPYRLTIHESVGLAHEPQVVEIAVPASSPSVFFLRDEKSGQLYPVQTSQQNPGRGYLLLSIAPDQVLNLVPAESTKSVALDSSVTITEQKDIWIVKNKAFAIELSAGNQQSAKSRTQPVLGPVRRVREGNNPWRGRTFFDTTNGVVSEKAEWREKGPVRSIYHYRIEFAEGGFYDLELTVDATGDFARLHEKFRGAASDQIVWDFTGNDLPERVTLLDSTAGYTPKWLHYHLDQRHARLWCWTQFSQLHDLSDGYALHFSGADDAVGFVTFEGGKWHGNALNHVEAWSRRWQAADITTRRLPADTKADSFPGTDSIPARGHSVNEPHFTVEGWLRRGERRFALVFRPAREWRRSSSGRVPGKKKAVPSPWAISKTFRAGTFISACKAACARSTSSMASFRSRTNWEWPSNGRWKKTLLLPASRRTQRGTTLGRFAGLTLARPKRKTPTASNSSTISFRPGSTAFGRVRARRTRTAWSRAGSVPTCSTSRASPRQENSPPSKSRAGVVGSPSSPIFTTPIIFIRALPPWNRCNRTTRSSRRWPACPTKISTPISSPCSATPRRSSPAIRPSGHGAKNSSTNWRRQLEYHMYPKSGVWEESHTYYQHVLATVLPLFLRRKADGISDDFADPNFQKLTAGAIPQMAPRNAVVGGSGISFPSATTAWIRTNYRYIYRELARGFAPHAPELAGNLAWVYQEMKGEKLSDVPALAPKFVTGYQEGLGFFMRGNAGSDAESLLALRSGMAWGHHHADDGSIQFYARGRALIVDSASSQAQKRGDRKHLSAGQSRTVVEGVEPLNHLWRFNRGWILEPGQEDPYLRGGGRSDFCHLAKGLAPHASLRAHSGNAGRG